MVLEGTGRATSRGAALKVEVLRLAEEQATVLRAFADPGRVLLFFVLRLYTFFCLFACLFFLAHG